MTGQVKEEILTRAGELGVQAVGGRIRFDPALLDDAEFCEDGGDFEYIDALGQAASWRMPRRSVGFTCCGTPVCYVRGPESRIRVERADGRAAAREGSGLTLAESAEVLTRSGEILRITVTVPDTPDGVR
jgi:hypothetical protein